MASDLCFGKNLLAQVESRLGGSLSCLRHKLGRNLGAGMVAFRLLPYGGLAGHACLVGCSHSLGRTGTSSLWLLKADGGVQRIRKKQFLE